MAKVNPRGDAVAELWDEGKRGVGVPSLEDVTLTIGGRTVPLASVVLGAQGRVHAAAGMVTPARLTFEATTEHEFKDLRLLWWMLSPRWLQAQEIGAIVAEGLFGWLR